MIIVCILAFFNLLTVSNFAQRTKRKVKTGEKIKIPSRHVDKVKPGSELKGAKKKDKRTVKKIKRKPAIKKQATQQQNFDEADALFGKRTKIKKKPSPAGPIPIPYPNIAKKKIVKKKISKNKKGTKLKPFSDGSTHKKKVKKK